jgi:spermidine/putrescine transport system substrate-binding protein
MTERDERIPVDPSAMQRALRYRLTRRSMLRGTGMGIAGFSLASFLAACGGGGDGGGSTADPTEVFGGKPGNKVMFANWPLYIDQSKDKNGDVYYPSLQKFTDETGIDVNYEAIIQSNEEFYGKIQPQLAAGDSTGWDIIVITNGRNFTLLTLNEWVYELDPAKHPNFDANAMPFAKDRPFDPGNKYSMPWQGGFTGIGVNQDMVNGEVTTMDDLANPDKVGTNSVGMLKADMADLVMINLGIDPVTSTPDDWKEAAKWLQMQRDSGTVRQYYDQGYIDDFTSGNLSATMAWSGDVMYYNIWSGYTNLEWVFPEGGALLWVDNMLVPVGAENAPGALEVMDWYYDPKIATMVTEWVLYMSPVQGVQDLILKDADQAEQDGYKGYAAKLYETAKNPYLFPDESVLSNASFGRSLTSDDEAEEWDNIFLPITQQ